MKFKIGDSIMLDNKAFFIRTLKKYGLYLNRKYKVSSCTVDNDIAYLRLEGLNKDDIAFSDIAFIKYKNNIKLYKKVLDV